jgi:hypothetical protein
MRPAERLRSVVDCGETPGNAGRWRLLEYRYQRNSYLYFERQERVPDGTWHVVGGAGLGLSAEDGIRRKAVNMRCSIDGEGASADVYAQGNTEEHSYPLTIRVRADFEIETEMGPIVG